MNIKNFFRTPYNWFKRYQPPKSMRQLINSLWAMFKQIVSASTGVVLAQLTDVAKEVCKRVGEDSSVITDGAKRRKAFKEIATFARIKGLEVKDSLINLAIEIAVNFLKERLD